MATWTITSGASTDDVWVGADNANPNGNSALYNGQVWMDAGNHPTTNYRPVVGFVFALPDLTGVAAGDVTDCYIELTGDSTATMPSGSTYPAVKLIDGGPSGGTFPTSINTGNSPKSMYDAATGVSPINWSAANSAGTSWASATATRGPNMAAHLSAIITAGVSTGDLVTVVVHGQNAAPNTARFQSRNHGTSGYWPRLVIVATVTLNASVTTTAPVAATAVGAHRRTWADVDYDYDNSRTISPDRRVMDVDEPFTTMPAGGYKAMMFVHGGTFVAGIEDSVVVAHRDLALRRGMTFVSVRYTLSDDGGTWNVASHPMPRQDLGMACQHLVNAFDVDEAQIVLTGHSAGGHICAEYILTHDDTATYTWAFTSSGTRGASEPDTSPSFRFPQAHAAQPRPRGLFLWAAPADLTEAYNQQNLLGVALRGYLGGRSSDSASTTIMVSSQREADITAISKGTTSTPYAGAPHRDRWAGIPVGYIEGRFTGGSAEITVAPSAGIVAYKDVLTDAGIPNTPDSATVNGLNASGGLSHWRTEHSTDPHTYCYSQADFSDTGILALWLNWLDAAVFSHNSPPSVASVVPTPSVSFGGDADVTTTAPAADVFVGTATVGVEVPVTTTAPSAPTAVGTATVGVEVPVTTTAPLVAFAPGTPSADASGNDSATTTAPVTAAAVGTASVEVSATVTTTAPAVITATGTPTVDAEVSDSTTTTAPVATWSVPTPTVTSDGNDSYTVVALAVPITVPTPDVATTGNDGVTLTAVLVPVSVPTPTVDTELGVTTTAPAVVALVGTPTADSAVVAVIDAPSATFAIATIDASGPPPPRRIRRSAVRPDHTHAVRRRSRSI